MKRLAVLLVVALGTPAFGGDRCGDLRTLPVAKLTARAQQRIEIANPWNARRRDWPSLVITVSIDRAPHLAGAILRACPGVLGVFGIDRVDPRNFRATVRLHVASFAVLTRIAQLPAVTSMSVFDPSVRFADPQIDLDVGL
jgi:hypothetical protein